MFGIIPFTYLRQTSVSADAFLVGDVIRFDDDNYAVVLQVNMEDDEVVLAGTDDNGVVYWNRTIPASEITRWDS